MANHPSAPRTSSPLFQLTLSRVRQFIREPAALFWTFAFPILLAMVLGVAFRDKPPPQPRVGVVDTVGSTWIANALTQSGKAQAVRLSAAEGAAALRDGKVDMLVDGGMNVGSAPHATFRYDPARTESLTARLVVKDALEAQQGRIDRVAVHDETVLENGQRYIDALIPGLLGWNVMSSSMWGVGYVVVSNRSHKLLKRFAATPMRRIHFLLSFILARLLFLVAEVATLWLFAWLVFDVHVQGSAVAFAFVTALGAFSFAGTALLVASRTASVEVAQGLMNLVMMPMWILSGTFFSYSRFPEVVQPFIRLLPLTAFNDALRGIANNGASLLSLSFELMVLVVWGGVSTVLALRLFRWR